MDSRHRLSPLVSFRVHGDSAVLVDHAAGEIHSLNREAGEVLERMDRGEIDFDEDEEELIDQLVEMGLAGDGARASSSGAAEQAGAGDLLDEINAEAERRLVPLHCQIELTYRCELRCRHCYLGHAGSAEAEELSTAEIVDLLDQLRDMGCLFLLLTGGEPFLRRDFEEIFAEARARRFATSFITSGWGFDPELLGRLARAGIDSAQVSLYGPDAATHDGMTGTSGSFDQALGCMRTLRDLGVRVRAAVTPTVDSVGGIEAVRDLLKRERIAAGLGIYMAPTRQGDEAVSDLTVDEAGLARVLAAFPMDSAPRMSVKGPSDRPCGAGADTLSVDPFGTVYPCLLMRTPAGSVRERPLAEIWLDSDVLKELRGLDVARLVDCPDCDLKDHCNRCGALALLEKKRLIDHSSFDCLQAEVVYNGNQ